MTTTEPTFNSDNSIATYTGSISKFELPAGTLSDLSDTSYLDDTEVVNVNTGVISYTPIRFNLRLKASKNQTRLDGTLAATNFINDKSGTCLRPTSASFSGSMIDNSTNGLGSFLNLAVTASASGYSSYDCTKATSASNYTTDTINITGKLIAPSRPDLILSLSGVENYTSTNNGPSLLTETITINLNYNLSSNSSDKFGFSGTVVRHPTVNETITLVLTSQDGIKLRWVKGASTKILSSDGQELGTWGSNSIIYFTDGSFVSL